QSRVPGECSERTCASGTRPGTQRKKREARYVCRLRLVVSPWVPGLAALARDTSVRGRGAQSEPLAAVCSHDVKQRSLVRSQAYVSSFPRPVCASGFVSFLRIHPPNEGVAERRQAHSPLLCRACEA